jgi:hypothetical protein
LTPKNCPISEKEKKTLPQMSHSVEVEERTFTSWVNLQLRKYIDLDLPSTRSSSSSSSSSANDAENYPQIRNLTTDFRDGTNLFYLSRVLSLDRNGEISKTKINKNPRNENERKQNIFHALDSFKKDGVALHSIGTDASPIERGDELITKGLIWQLILFYHIGLMYQAENGDKKTSSRKGKNQKSNIVEVKKNMLNGFNLNLKNLSKNQLFQLFSLTNTDPNQALSIKSLDKSESFADGMVLAGLALSLQGINSVDTPKESMETHSSPQEPTETQTPEKPNLAQAPKDHFTTLTAHYNNFKLLPNTTQSTALTNAAIHTAYDLANIPIIITAEDILHNFNPKALLTYLSYFSQSHHGIHHEAMKAQDEVADEDIKSRDGINCEDMKSHPEVVQEGLVSVVEEVEPMVVNVNGHGGGNGDNKGEHNRKVGFDDEKNNENEEKSEKSEKNEKNDTKLNFSKKMPILTELGPRFDFDELILLKNEHYLNRDNDDIENDEKNENNLDNLLNKIQIAIENYEILKKNGEKDDKNKNCEISPTEEDLYNRLIEHKIRLEGYKVQKDKLVQLMGKIDQIEKDNNNLLEQNERLQKERENVEKGEDKLKEKIVFLNNSIVESTETQKTLILDIDRLTKDLDESNRFRCELLEQISQSQSLGNDKDAQNDEKISEMEFEIAKLKAELINSEKERQILQNESNSAQEVKDLAIDGLQKRLVVEMEEYEAKLAAQKEEKKNEKDGKNNNKKTNTENDKKIKKLEKLLKSTQDSLSAVEVQHNTEKSLVERLGKELEAVKNELIEMEIKNSELKITIEKSNQQFEIEKNNFRNEIRNQNFEIEKLLAEMAKNDAKVNADTKTAQGMNINREGMIEQLERELEKTRNGLDLAKIEADEFRMKYEKMLEKNEENRQNDEKNAEKVQFELDVLREVIAELNEDKGKKNVEKDVENNDEKNDEKKTQKEIKNREKKLNEVEKKLLQKEEELKIAQIDLINRLEEFGKAKLELNQGQDELENEKKKLNDEILNFEKKINFQNEKMEEQREEILVENEKIEKFKLDLNSQKIQFEQVVDGINKREGDLHINIAQFELKENELRNEKEIFEQNLNSFREKEKNFEKKNFDLIELEQNLKKQADEFIIKITNEQNNNEEIFKKLEFDNTLLIEKEKTLEKREEKLIQFEQILKQKEFEIEKKQCELTKLIEETNVFGNENDNFSNDLNLQAAEETVSKELGGQGLQGLDLIDKKIDFDDNSNPTKNTTNNNAEKVPELNEEKEIRPFGADWEDWARVLFNIAIIGAIYTIIKK